MVYNVDLNKARAGVGFGVVFFLAGLFFFCVMSGVFLSSFTRKSALDGKTKAYHVEWHYHYNDEGSTMYSPTYYYTVDGKNYVCDADSSGGIKNGKGIVYYDTKNPNICMTDFNKSIEYIFLIFLFLPLIFIFIGGKKILVCLKKGKIARELAISGVLVKGVPYEIINSGMSVNDRKIKAFSIMYTFPDGISRNLISQGIFDHVLKDGDGLCDFLYDPNNYDNYFIDLEITTTGIGAPNIIYYEHTAQSTINMYNDNYSDNMYYNPRNKY